MNVTQIKCFLSVAQTLNFTETAKTVFISQQAISKYIMNLESELGVSLFIREHGNVELTDAGEYYYDLWTGWMSRIRSALDDCKLQRKGMEQLLNIGYSIWIDPLGEINTGVRSFRDANPFTTFKARQYHNNRLIEELDNGALDIVLIPSDQVFLDNSYATAFIAKDEMCFYAPADVEGGAVNKKCWGLPFLEVPSWDWNFLEWKRIAARDLSSLNVEPDEIITLPNFHSLIAMLDTGRYVVICDDRFGYLRGYDNLRKIPIESTSGISCVWKKYDEHPLIHKFVRHMSVWYE